VTSNDLQAFGVCKALYELGIHVPQDVSVVGFDDMPGSDFHIPALTTVRPDFEALGRSAMQELLGMLGIPSDEGTVPTREAAEGTILIPAELVVRETSAAPR
jgi:DNA-binding LacI/PurR family transcriptional regulator